MVDDDEHLAFATQSLRMAGSPLPGRRSSMAEVPLNFADGKSWPLFFD